MDGAAEAWFDCELAGCSFADKRLNKRLRRLLERMEASMGASIPLACQDWANTKAAYRFFSNDRVNEEAILAGHFEATRSRFFATDGPILVLQDTTEFTYQRERSDRIGLMHSLNCGKDKYGGRAMRTVCGLLMHFELGRHAGWPAAWPGCGQVLDPDKVQGHGGAEEKDQPDAGAHRREGELPLAREHAPVDRTIRRSGAMHPHRRSRERHLRAVLHGP